VAYSFTISLLFAIYLSWILVLKIESKNNPLKMEHNEHTVERHQAEFSPQTALHCVESNSSSPPQEGIAFDEKATKRLLWRIDLTLIPFLALLYLYGIVVSHVEQLYVYIF
jgi:hypothetical protein